MDAVADQPLELNKKIAFLCERDGVTPSELARIVGVSPQSATQYFKKAVPRAAELNSIAAHFGVSIYWLLDDAASVEYPQTDADRLADQDLEREFARRYRREILEFLEAVEAAEQTDTMETAKTLFRRGLDADVSDVNTKAARVLAIEPFIEGIYSKYDPGNYAYAHNDEMPGADRDPEDFVLESIISRALEAPKKNYGLLWIQRFFKLRFNYRTFPTRRDHYVGQISQFLEKIEAGKAPDPIDAPHIVDSQVFNSASAQSTVFRDSAMKTRAKMTDQGYKF